jgi:CDP-paratose 2-epimerase
MRVLITGICGFAGSHLARGLLQAREGLRISGVDNLSRPGSETNLEPLRSLGCEITVADLRDPSVMAGFPGADWLIDAAAEPSVLAGVSGGSSVVDLLQNNLFSTVPMLEFCRRHSAVFTLLSTSRVYGIKPLSGIPLTVNNGAFTPEPDSGFSGGVQETFPSTPPVSLYGASKRCAETLALEFGEAFEFPVWLNRCGVLAGAGQFGKADQGIFSFWIHRWAAKLPLKYIGFGGRGFQVRDCLHPLDLVPLLLQQYEAGASPEKPRVLNVSGGAASATSLSQLSAWCAQRLGAHTVAADPLERPYDLPWVVLDSGLAKAVWQWHPKRNAESIFEEIAAHALENPRWLDLCTH